MEGDDMVKKKDIPVANEATEWDRSLAGMPEGSMKRMMLKIRETVAAAGPVDTATDAKTEAAALHAAVPVSERVQEQLPFLAPLSTDMCRVSFFFPMNRREKRDFLENLVIMKNAWGEMSFLGPRLSTYEEDVFLAALALAKMQGNNYVYDGPIAALLRLLTRSSHPSAADYKRVYRSLKLLTVSALELKMNKQNTASVDNILTAVKWDKDTRRIKIVFNPYFTEKYTAGAYTLIGIEQRLRLRGSVTKALHRFVSSQREEWMGHYLVVAGALNLAVEQHAFALRRTIKSAITELIKAGVLHDNSGFVKKNQVLLQKINPQKKRTKAVHA